MKFVVFFILAVASFSAHACKLDGKWKSHKTKTLSELFGSALGNDQKIKLSRVFGQMVIEYKNCRVAIVDFEGAKTEYRFEVIEETTSSLVTKDLSTGEITRMTFNGNCYTTPVKGMGFNEHFCKE